MNIHFMRACLKEIKDELLNLFEHMIWDRRIYMVIPLSKFVYGVKHTPFHYLQLFLVRLEVLTLICV